MQSCPVWLKQDKEGLEIWLGSLLPVHGLDHGEQCSVLPLRVKRAETFRWEMTERSSDVHACPVCSEMVRWPSLLQANSIALEV